MLWQNIQNKKKKNNHLLPNTPLYIREGKYKDWNNIKSDYKCPFGPCVFVCFSHPCDACLAGWGRSRPHWSALHQAGCCWQRPCCNLPPGGALSPTFEECVCHTPPKLASRTEGHCHPDLSHTKRTNTFWLHHEIWGEICSYKNWCQHKCSNHKAKN